MNLPQFLRAVDKATSEMGMEELKSCIHELARTEAERNRMRFLEIICSGMKQEKAEIESHSNRLLSKDLKKEVDEIMKVLSDINNGERYLYSEYNEEWDDWYNSDVPEILYADSEEILPDIEEAISLLHKCLDTESYEEGCKLAELLSALEIMDGGECDNGPLGIEQLYEEQLLSGSFETVVRESLFLSYMGNEMSYRPEELYCMMENYNCHKVKLEDLLQMGSQDLPDFDVFLPLWIDYLGLHSSYNSKSLILEAHMMLEDEEQQLEIAKKFAKPFPDLFLQMLKVNPKAKDFSRIFQIGLLALEEIPENYTIRAEIALLTADSICKLESKVENGDSVEIPADIDLCKKRDECWLEAFHSDTNVVNFLRIRLLCNDWNQCQSQVELLCEKAFQKTNEQRNQQKSYLYSYSYREPEKNQLYSQDHDCILFFEGKFDQVIKLGLSKKESLGWSYTFMKTGIALFLLLLFEGEELQSGLNAMALRAADACNFEIDTYVAGTGQQAPPDQKNHICFWNAFKIWKAEITITTEEREQWSKMIEQLIARRTEAIMQASRRNYYNECAAFIAAFGEMKESLGDEDAKARIMSDYKKEYSRRSAFHRELREYGQ